MDRLNKISTPDLSKVGNLDVIKLRRDGQYNLTSAINGRITQI